MGNDWNENGYNNGSPNEENGGYGENGERDYAFQTLNKRGKPKTIGWSIAALVTGIISAVTCSFGWSSLILGIAAIVFSSVSRKTLGYFDGRSIAGLILGIFGTVFGTVMITYSFTIDDEQQRFLWDWIRKMFESTNTGGTGI